VVFEVDQPTLFQVKEAILRDHNWPLMVKSRIVVPFNFVRHNKNSKTQPNWPEVLLQKGFNPSVANVWLLEWLLYCLPHNGVTQLMEDVGKLSAAGSAIFHDSVSRVYATAGVAPGVAPFLSGSDVYGKLWKDFGGFDRTFVRDFDASIKVDRQKRNLADMGGPQSEATPERCKGQYKDLFVEVEKTA
jgi:hypothetical protein